MDLILLRLLISHLSYLALFSKCGGREILTDSWVSQWAVLLEIAVQLKWITEFPLSQVSLELILELADRQRYPSTAGFDWEFIREGLEKIQPLTKSEIINVLPQFKERLMVKIVSTQSLQVARAGSLAERYQVYENFANLLKEIQSLDSEGLMKPTFSWPEHLHTVLVRRETQLTKAIPSGFPTLDKILRGGFRPGEVYGITASPKSGKTSLVFTFAINILCSPFPRKVLILETDMPLHSTEQKLDEIFFYKYYRQLPCVELWNDFQTRLTTLVPSGAKIDLKHFLDQELTASGFENAFQQGGPYDMVILDSIDRMGTPHQKRLDRWEKEDLLINQVVDLARKLNTVLWIPKQPTKESAKRAQKGDGDVRGSWESIFRADLWGFINGEKNSFRRSLDIPVLRNYPSEPLNHGLYVPLIYDRASGYNEEDLGGAYGGIKNESENPAFSSLESPGKVRVS